MDGTKKLTAIALTNTDQLHTDTVSRSTDELLKQLNVTVLVHRSIRMCMVHSNTQHTTIVRYIEHCAVYVL